MFATRWSVNRIFEQSMSADHHCHSQAFSERAIDACALVQSVTAYFEISGHV